MYARCAGAQAEVRTRNREALYSLSKQLQKAAKKFASSRPAAEDGAAPLPAQPKQSLAAQPADAAARITAAGGSAAGTPAAKRAAKKALSRLARASLAADAAAAADELAQAVPSATVAASLEADAAAAVLATPVSAKRAKRKKQQTGSQHMPAAGAVNGSAVSAEAGAGTGAKVHRTRSAANANGAVPPGSDATPGEQFGAAPDHEYASLLEWLPSECHDVSVWAVDSRYISCSECRRGCGQRLKTTHCQPPCSRDCCRICRPQERALSAKAEPALRLRRCTSHLQLPQW